MIEQKIENFIDNFLEKIFSGFEIQILCLNIALGFVFIIFGLIILKKTSKNIKIIGWISFSIGIIGIINSIANLINK